jgi:hypothetical protein
MKPNTGWSGPLCLSFAGPRLLNRNVSPQLILRRSPVSHYIFVHRYAKIDLRGAENLIEKIDDREGKDFFLNDPQKPDISFPDLKYFLEHRPVFYSPPLNTWFTFRLFRVQSG